MPWVRIDDAFYDHDKWVGADLAEIGLWAVLLAWSNRNLSDGLVPRGLLARFGASPETVAAMVARDVLEDGGDSYRIHGYLDWQRDAATILEGRQRDRERKRRGREPDSDRIPDGIPDASDDLPTTEEPQPHGEENSRVFDADFEDWWKPWPQKRDKAEARAKYRARRRQGASHADLCKARDHYIPTVEDARFCKYGSTFLAPQTWTEWLEPPAINGRGKVDYERLSS